MEFPAAGTCLSVNWTSLSPSHHPVSLRCTTHTRGMHTANPERVGKGNSFKGGSLRNSYWDTEIPLLYCGPINHGQTPADLAFQTLRALRCLKAPPHFIWTTPTDAEKGGCACKSLIYPEISSSSGKWCKGTTTISIQYVCVQFGVPVSFLL